MALDLGLDLGSTLGNIGGSIIGAITGANSAKAYEKAAEKQIEASKWSTAEQLKWERERATSAHQWEIQDLEKAGLNPILSAGGSGASTGGINPPMPDTSGYGKAGDVLYQAVNNAFNNLIENRAKIATAKQAESQANLNNTTTNLTNQKITTEKIIQIVQKATAGKLRTETAINEVKKLIHDEELKQERVNTKWQPYEKWIDNGMKIAGPVLHMLEMWGLGGIIRGKKPANELPGGKYYNGNTINNYNNYAPLGY